jgi:hypothetical protein
MRDEMKIILEAKDKFEMMQLATYIANEFLKFHWDDNIKSIEGGCRYGNYRIERVQP